MNRQAAKKRNQWIAVAPFLLPNLAGFLTFTLLPAIASILLCFTDWDLLGSPRFIGMANFVRLLGFQFEDGSLQANDPAFWYYLWNTLVLMLAIPFGMAGSLALAVMLNRKIPGRFALRSIYFLPSMCVPVAVYLLWRWIFNTDFGLLNWALAKVGIQGPSWLTEQHWAKPSLMIAGLWGSVGGYNMVLYLAGLQGIPAHYYEAATIDGASPWQQFRHITWPLLAPTSFFILTMSIIGGLQGGFDAAFIMTDGGPAGATTTLMYYIYNNAFEWSKMGYAATISWFLFALVFLGTMLNWRYGGKHAQQYY